MPGPCACVAPTARNENECIVETGRQPASVAQWRTLHTSGRIDGTDGRWPAVPFSTHPPRTMWRTEELARGFVPMSPASRWEYNTDVVEEAKGGKQVIAVV